MLRAAAIASLLVSSCCAVAQSGSPRPEFEVASIKLNKSADSRVMVIPATGGRFTATNIPLQYLVTAAYRIQKDYQLSGAPPWLPSERYDIEAKAEGDPSFDAMLVMLQTLFEDRLQLKFHRVTKELPVYALVVSKPGKLHQSEGNCAPPHEALPPREPVKLAAAPCRFMILPGRLGSQNAAMKQLTDALSRLTDRIVLDKTNLTGEYDINLEFTGDQGEFQAPAAAGLTPTPDANRPSLFTALQEQLGLKLESQKGPVEMIVIDHIERPSEN
jgi:uncharacterized protein (TIGR03435 family)